MAEHDDPPPPGPPLTPPGGGPPPTDEAARPSEAHPRGLRRDPERMLEVRVGIFVLVAVAIIVGVLLLIGAKSGTFTHRAMLHAAFSGVGGLTEGAPVRLSGVDVGAVKSVDFTHDGTRSFVQVDLQVSRKALRFIGQDSVARIGSKGLLGNKLVNISLASPRSPRLREGDWVATVAPVTLDRLMEQTTDVLAETQKLVATTAQAAQALANPKTLSTLHDTLAALERLLRQAQTGPGLAHDFFYSPEQARAFRRLLADSARLVAQLDQAATRANTLLSGVDADGAQVVNNVSRAAAAVGRVAGQVEGSHVVPNLDRSSRDLAQILAYVRSGNGTLGAVIADPTVYNQLVDVLGGIQRSRLLRALVRYSLSKEDKKREARPVDPAQQGPIREHTKEPEEK